MIDLLAVYECPKCGKVLEDQVERGETFDCENDEVYVYYFCTKCNSTGVTRKDNCWEEVDHERWLWATGFYDDLVKEMSWP